LTVTCPDTVLDPGESMTCTAAATAVAGQHADVGTATGDPPCGEAASSSDSAHYFGWEPQPAIDLEKLVNGQDADTPPGPMVELGAKLAWTFIVTNTGDVGLVGVSVSDVVLGTVHCPQTVLAVGESMTCTAGSVAAACQHVNVATASGTASNGKMPAVSDQDPAYYFGVAHPGIALEKLVEGQDADESPGPDLLVGAPVHWSYVATNSGDIALSVAVSDDRDAVVTCPKTMLAPGESMTCTASGTAVAGQYENVGLALGSAACGEPVQAMDPAHYYGRTPGIGIQKLTNGEDADTPPGPSLQVGSDVLWTYVVTNTGDTSLTNVTVGDDRGETVTCPKTKLAAGESMTCTATGSAVAGQYANLGTARGTPTVGPEVSASDPSHYFGFRPLIGLEKRVNGQDADDPPGPSLRVGSTIAWTYLVTNSGEVRLTDVGVSDDQGWAVSCPKTVLEPAESMTCTASSNALKGPHHNVGTATGTPPAGPLVTATDPANYKGVEPGIDVEKLINGYDSDAAPGPYLVVGSLLLYTYVVTNTGDMTLTGVEVTDSDGFPVTCPKTTLAPGESMTCSTCAGETLGVRCPAYCVVKAGQHSDIGTAVGTPDDGGSDVTDQDPAHYFGYQPQGCTPGYWKNHTGSWPATGYSTSQDVDTVFSNVNTYYPSLGNDSLWHALYYGGGSGNSGAAEILLRAGVAAVLNAAHPSVFYPRTAAAVIGDVNAALLQNRDAMLALAAQLDADNNLGCPLN
jgi:hypothetical protein